MEWAGLSFIVFLAGICCLAIHSMGPKNDPWFSYGNEPDDDCPDCDGTGVLNEGHDHFECECPCTERIYY